jgi:hypothetical protein
MFVVACGVFNTTYSSHQLKKHRKGKGKGERAGGD